MENGLKDRKVETLKTESIKDTIQHIQSELSNLYATVDGQSVDYANPQLCSYDRECGEEGTARREQGCGRKTAADGATTYCCDDFYCDESTNNSCPKTRGYSEVSGYGGYDYCTNMPPGSDCWSDTQCNHIKCDEDGFPDCDYECNGGGLFGKGVCVKI